MNRACLIFFVFMTLPALAANSSESCRNRLLANASMTDLVREIMKTDLSAQKRYVLIAPSKEFHDETYLALKKDLKKNYKIGFTLMGQERIGNQLLFTIEISGEGRKILEFLFQIAEHEGNLAWIRGA